MRFSVVGTLKDITMGKDKSSQNFKDEFPSESRTLSKTLPSQKVGPPRFVNTVVLPMPTAMPSKNKHTIGTYFPQIFTNIAKEKKRPKYHLFYFIHFYAKQCMDGIYDNLSKLPLWYKACTL